MGRLMAVFICISLVEVNLLITVGNKIGAMNVVGIVILTAMIGISFARSQGLQILARMQHSFHQGQIPGRELVEGAMVMAGGLLLIAPGLIADVLGFTLLFPLTRFLYMKLVLSFFKKRFRQGRVHVYPTRPQEWENTIDVQPDGLAPGSEEEQEK